MNTRLLVSFTLSAVVIAGCGGGTKTVATQTVSRTVTQQVPATTTRAVAPGNAPTTAAGTVATTSTLPAKPPLTLAQAQVIVLGKGYDASGEGASGWDSSAPLNVLVGLASGSADGHNWQAYFFYRDRFLGTDTSNASSTLLGAGRIDKNTVRLRYLVYHSGDGECCPLGGKVWVRYHWNGSRLVSLDPIPVHRSPW